MAVSFSFSAIVGQDEMKLAILIAAIDPSIGGVLVFGDRGTGKSTAVRALAALLPKMRAVVGCRYGCDPANTSASCEDCAALRGAANTPLKSHLVPVPVVDLPLGATEDRVVGALDLERALSQGVKVGTSKHKLNFMKRSEICTAIFVDVVQSMRKYLADGNDNIADQASKTDRKSVV